MKSSFWRTACACEQLQSADALPRIGFARRTAVRGFDVRRRSAGCSTSTPAGSVLMIEVAVEIAASLPAAASPFDDRAVVDRGRRCRRSPVRRARRAPVPPAPMTAARRASPGSSAAKPSTSVLSARMRSPEVHERVHGTRARARSSPTSAPCTTRERERLFLERRGDAQAARLARAGTRRGSRRSARSRRSCTRRRRPSRGRGGCGSTARGCGPRDCRRWRRPCRRAASRARIRRSPARDRA